ncbi:MAG: SpoIIE family protein phosphatase [Bacteroidales bacterium]|nr:SpoIIE family protein phosphatase [Bacteroidales bacterium]MBN2819017.1 SpoIIE family protein phosphatase [Bacteroidales bacterium]
MADKYFIEVDYHQRNHEGERICGDVFLSGKVREEGRIVIVLSDGMGHGVKASVLATLTATMALNFTKEHREPSKTAEIIMNTLPECSERKMSYATFTIIDIDYEGNITILEYDNPESILIRDRQVIDLKRKNVVLESERNCGKKLKLCNFKGEKGDRIVFATDGIAQSGLGTPRFPFGWGMDNAGRFALDLVKNTPQISARQLASRLVNAAFRNDGFAAKDDITSGVIYLREPRELLIATGPPFEKVKDREFANLVKEFEGKKIVMGATTGDILARELELKVQDGQDFADPDLPPLSFLEGIDLFTEGILTLRKVEKILTTYKNNVDLGRGPADEIVKLILDSDEIRFIVGTRINIAHQDPNMQIDLEIRRTVVKRISFILEEKFLKKVKLGFI